MVGDSFSFIRISESICAACCLAHHINERICLPSIASRRKGWRTSSKCRNSPGINIYHRPPISALAVVRLRQGSRSMTGERQRHAPLSRQETRPRPQQNSYLNMPRQTFRRGGLLRRSNACQVNLRGGRTRTISLPRCKSDSVQ